MNDRPIRSSVAGMAGAIEEDTGELKQTGADFYLRMIEQMQAVQDPLLGQAFGPPADEETTADLASLSVEQKLRDKNAKVKLAGIEQLGIELEACSEANLRDLYFAPLLEAMFSPMPNLQKASLELGLKILQEKNESRWIDTKEVIKLLSEKVVPNAKPQIKKCLADFFLTFLKLLGKDSFVEHIKEPLSTKNPKIKAALVRIVADLLAQVGLRELPAVKLFDLLAKDSDNPNPAVKKEFAAFAAEVYRWVGDHFAPKLAAIKKMAADEITKLYDEKKNADGGRPPLPLLEEYRAAYMKKEESSSSKQADAGVQDSYELFEAVDAFKTFSEKWTEKVLTQQKWTDKKTLTDEFIDYCQKHPRLTGNYTPVVALSKRLLEDSNINVQTNAARMLTAISKGLRKELGRDGRKIVGLLLPKLKERKKLTDEIIDCLKNSVYYAQPGENLEDYEALFVAKNNLLKGNTLEWFDWYVANSPPARVLAFLTAFRPLLIRLAEDGAVEVREANLGVITKIVHSLGTTSDEVARLMEKLPKAQLEKLQASKGSETSCRSSGLIEQTTLVSQPPQHAKRPDLGAALEATKRFDIEAPVRPNKREQNLMPQTGAASDFRPDLNLEAASAALSNKGLTAEEISQAMSQSWKLKMEFIQRLNGVLVGGVTTEECDALATVLTLLLKQFKETNPNIVKEYLTLVETVFETSIDQAGGRFLYSWCWCIIEKFSDAKFGEKARQLLQTATSRHKSRAVLYLCDLVSTKAPTAKSHAQLLVAIGDLINSDPKSMPKKEILVLAKEGAANANNQVKDEAVNLICTLFRNFGDQIKKFLAELSPQLRKQIEPKLEKIQPIACEVDENAPKKEISVQICKLFGQLNEQKWISRKDALIEAAKIIKAAGRVSSKGLTDFGTLLKDRLLDSNQVVAKEALQVVKVYVKALGSDFKGQSRLLLPLIVPFFNDKTDSVRDLARDIFDSSQAAIGSEWVLNLLVSYLSDQSADLVVKVLEYLNVEQASEKLARCESKVLAKHLINSLLNKNKSVRLLAERLFEKIQALISREGWIEACRDLNPTMKQQAEAMIGRVIQHAMDIERPLSQSSCVGEVPFKGSKKMEEEATSRNQAPFTVPIEKSLTKVKTAIGNLSSQLSNGGDPSLVAPDYEQEITDSIFIKISYNDPRDEEITEIKRKLALYFEESTAEKMFSNEQTKLFDCLSSLGLIRMTNHDRYVRLLPLILNWMYVRVFDTNRKHILDLLAEFLMNNLEDLSTRRLSISYDLQNKVLHVLAKILDHHPDREQSLRFINKFCLEVSRSSYLQEFYSLLLDSISSSDIDPQITSILLTQLLDFIDLRKVISIRNLDQLEKYTASLDDLTKNEIYHFYSKCLNFLGSKFFEIFQFTDKSKLQRYFALANPEEEVPKQTAMTVCLRRLQSGDREEQVRAMTDLAKAIDSSQESTLKEIKLHSSILVIAVLKLHQSLLADVYSSEYVDALCIFRQKLFSLKKFTGSLSCSSLQELLDVMLVSLIRIYRESKQAIGERIPYFQRIITNTNIAVLSLIVSVPKSVGPPTLIDMLAFNYRELLHEPTSEIYKTKQTIIINCILNVAKKFSVATDDPETGISGLLDKIDCFFSEFEEVEKSPAHRALRTLVTKLCELLGDRIWNFFNDARSPSALTPARQNSQVLSNLIKVALVNQQAALQTEESLYRRRKDPGIGDKENRELRDLEIQRLAKETGSLTGREESGPLHSSTTPN